MKISARTRADAIAICEQRHDEKTLRVMVIDTAEDLGASRLALGLAWDAWRAVTGYDVSLAYWLEASGLLRDGWCPSGWDVVAKAVTP